MNEPERDNRRRLFEVMALAFETESRELHDLDSPATVPGWDSLAHLTFVLALEEAFKILLTTAEIVEMENVAAVRRVLFRHGIPTELAGHAGDRHPTV